MKQSMKSRTTKAEKDSFTLIRGESVTDCGRSYRYELRMRESPFVASYRLPLYSVSVHFTDEIGRSSEAECADVFADIGKAIVFFDKLVKGLVTPIDLPYVLEDEIGR